MMFQHDHGLTVDGIAGPQVWHAAIADAISGKLKLGGYSYVYVHRNVPQLLTLWHNGHVVLTSPGNTGVPAAPTALGTWPVFEHIPVGRMSGTKPGRLALRRPGHPLDQLLPRRRGAARVQPRVVRHAAEPRLRRAAARPGGEGVALHADRDARHDRELSVGGRVAPPPRPL